MKNRFIILFFAITILIVCTACGKQPNISNEGGDNFDYWGYWKLASLYQSPINPTTSLVEDDDWGQQEITIFGDEFTTKTMSVKKPEYQIATYNSEQLVELGVSAENAKLDFPEVTTAIIIQDPLTKEKCLFLINSERELLYVSNTGYIYKLELVIKE
jgi:hypothetical protein